jgi:hypothetical protein
VVVGCVVLCGLLAGCGGTSGNAAAPKGSQAATEKTLTCTDEVGDVKVAGTKRAVPKFTDLRTVTWRRTDDGATVSFLSAASVPKKLPQTKKQWGQVTFSVYFQQGSAKTLIDTRLQGGSWKITSRGKPVTGKAAVVGGSLVLTLPSDLIAPSGTIDLADDVVVGAKVTAQAKAKSKLTTFTDANCRTGQAESTQTWPVPKQQQDDDDDDGGSKTKAKIKLKKSKKKRR